MSQNNSEASKSLPKQHSEAAKRALAEAEARRNSASEGAQPCREIGGRRGLDPVRYGDWEKNGIISDF